MSKVKKVPLAERLRPKLFNEVVGQKQLLGPKGMMTFIIKHKQPQSIILWGPPGTGKTSIARLYAQAFDLRFETLSPIFSGVGDLKKLLQQSDPDETILLFVDEIHRFNKAQQDAVYKAFNQAIDTAYQTAHYSPPLTILNAPTPLMKKMGYGKGYIYDHATPEGFSGQEYFPEQMKRCAFYFPTERGFEKELKEKIENLKRARNGIAKNKTKR